MDEISEQIPAWLARLDLSHSPSHNSARSKISNASNPSCASNPLTLSNTSNPSSGPEDFKGSNIVNKPSIQQTSLTEIPPEIRILLYGLLFQVQHTCSAFPDAELCRFAPYGISIFMVNRQLSDESIRFFYEKYRFVYISAPNRMGALSSFLSKMRCIFPLTTLPQKAESPNFALRVISAHRFTPGMYGFESARAVFPALYLADFLQFLQMDQNAFLAIVDDVTFHFGITENPYVFKDPKVAMRQLLESFARVKNPTDRGENSSGIQQLIRDDAPTLMLDVTCEGAGERERASTLDAVKASLWGHVLDVDGITLQARAALDKGNHYRLCASNELQEGKTSISDKTWIKARKMYWLALCCRPEKCQEQTTHSNNALARIQVHASVSLAYLYSKLGLHKSALKCVDKVLRPMFLESYSGNEQLLTYNECAKLCLVYILLHVQVGEFSELALRMATVAADRFINERWGVQLSKLRNALQHLDALTGSSRIASGLRGTSAPEGDEDEQYKKELETARKIVRVILSKPLPGEFEPYNPVPQYD